MLFCKKLTCNSSYYGWACSSVVFAWKRGIWVIILKRKCLCIKYFNVLAILSYFWLILPMMRHCTAYGAPTEVTRWDGRTYHGISIALRADTTEHLNMLFFRKICVWRYASPYYLLDWVHYCTFAVDQDPNASLSCTFTWKLLNCRLNHNNCYSEIHKSCSYLSVCLSVCTCMSSVEIQLP